MAISRVLIANRGEIAVRVIRACRELGLETVVTVSDADRDSSASKLADRSICIGPADASGSYLNVDAIVLAALATKSDAVHPGYGFLSESPSLAQKCAENGLRFIGPKAEHMRLMGHKIEARKLAIQSGVPVLPGSEKVGSTKEAKKKAKEAGFPVMLKAAAGGGGRGMQVVRKEAELADTFLSASAEAKAAFGDGTLYLERFVSNARHIEVQVIGDTKGNIVHLGERDCSLQRRHQKIVEESPAPHISNQFREDICRAAVRLATDIGYENAGTVEFIVDQDEQKFYFLEMNTRIQVEHPVTEMVTGIDLVQEQFHIADDRSLGFSQSDITFEGHAIECRINAEIPSENFRPSPGQIVRWRPPAGQGVRVDTHCYEDYTVPIYYDSMLAKLIILGSERNNALDRMSSALEDFILDGVGSNLEFLREVVKSEEFVAGQVSTSLVDRLVERIISSKEQLN